MGIYDRLSDWPEIAKEILARTVPNYKRIFVLGQSWNCKYSSSYRFTDKEVVVISFNKYRNVFVAWSAHIHNFIHGTAEKLTLTSVYPSDDVQENEIKCVYTYRNTHGFEKIAFIGINALYEFCMNFDYYLTPHSSDEGFNSPALYISYDNELKKLEAGDNEVVSFTSRAKETVSRLRRDPSFRKRVLEEYGYRCIVCGCSEEKILEAAHIVDVQYSDDDSTANGLCLCCNHHKLYDSALLSFDWDNQTFSCSSISEHNMPWYEAAKLREFKLFMPE
ncbi:MAG: HNH endonuclease [Oscillospiraceae bacterium]|nr:HNH endonuclease [Oscillospiraceae bacterium]